MRHPRCVKTYTCGRLSPTGTPSHNAYCYCVRASLVILSFHLCVVLCVCVRVCVVHDCFFQVNTGLRWHLSVPLRSSCLSLCSHQAGSCSPNHNLTCLEKQAVIRYVLLDTEAALGEISNVKFTVCVIVLCPEKNFTLLW